MIDDDSIEKLPSFGDFCGTVKFLKDAALEVCMIIPLYQRLMEMLDNILTREITQLLSLMQSAIATFAYLSLLLTIQKSV